MAQKIVSPRAELTVLRAICHKDKKIAGTVLGSVDESYFDSVESVELLGAMKKHLAETGEVPSYKLVIEDPGVSQEARSFFKDSDATVQSVEEAHKAVRTLNKYRQLRMLYQMASHVDQQMQKGKIDLDALLEEVSNRISTARTTKTTKDSFLHFGKNNNSMELVKDLLYGDASEDVIPTGVKVFDDESGGFMRGSLVTLGASSGGGKCCSLDTRIQLSTLVIELDDDATIECEPEDTLIVKVGNYHVTKEASRVCEGDCMETDPLVLVQLIAQGFPKTA